MKILLNSTVILIMALLMFAPMSMAQQEIPQPQEVPEQLEIPDQPIQPDVIPPLDNLKLLTLTGASVVDIDQNKIGTIENVIMDMENGTIQFAIVAVGGILGIGGNLYPVPFAQLKIMDEENTFTCLMPSERFKDAPKFNKMDWEKRDETWVDAIHRFYEGEKISTVQGSQSELSEPDPSLQPLQSAELNPMTNSSEPQNPANAEYSPLPSNGIPLSEQEIERLSQSKAQQQEQTNGLVDADDNPQNLDEIIGEKVVVVAITNTNQDEFRKLSNEYKENDVVTLVIEPQIDTELEKDLGSNSESEFKGQSTQSTLGQNQQSPQTERQNAKQIIPMEQDQQNLLKTDAKNIECAYFVISKDKEIIDHGQIHASDQQKPEQVASLLHDLRVTLDKEVKREQSPESIGLR